MLCHPQACASLPSVDLPEFVRRQPRDLEYNLSFCRAPFTESFFSSAPLFWRISRSCASTNSTEINWVDQDLLLETKQILIGTVKVAVLVSPLIL